MVITFRTTKKKGSKLKIQYKYVNIDAFLKKSVFQNYNLI